MTAPHSPATSGMSIDGWTVVKELGNGGFAVVYLGEKQTRRCALKLARHRDSSGDDKQTHARTMRELTALLLLDHPNIVRHQGYGYAERGNVYLALDYVEGWTMAEWAERKHPTFREVLTVFDKLAGALSYMHSRGILHRDLKLSNVLIRKSDGEPVIIDFSCATFAAAEELTDSGLPPGTDRFRAPEQFRWLMAHRDQHRARYAYQVADEVFALGAMLYDLLTDARPTAVETRASLNSPTVKPPAASTQNRRVPEYLSDLVESMLSREPARRPVDTEALRRQLGDLLASSSEEYQRSVHPPSEQLPIESSPEKAALVDGHKAESPLGGVRARGLAVLAAVGVLVAAVSLWLSRDVPPTVVQPPSERLGPALRAPISTPPHSVPPAMSLSSPAAVAQKSPDSVAQVQKEGPIVKNAPTTEVPLQGRQTRGRARTTAAAECATMTLVAALAAGCPGAQIRPESFTCPAGAEEAMREDLRWEVNESFSVNLDSRYKRGERVWFTAGAEVEGVVPKGVDSRQRQVAPPGTRFYGKAYYLSDKMGRSEGPALVVRYDRVKLPGQDERPVCFVVEMTAYGYEDGRVQASNGGGGFVVDRWP